MVHQAVTPNVLPRLLGIRVSLIRLPRHGLKHTAWRKQDRFSASFPIGVMMQQQWSVVQGTGGACAGGGSGGGGAGGVCVLYMYINSAWHLHVHTQTIFAQEYVNEQNMNISITIMKPPTARWMKHRIMMYVCRKTWMNYRGQKNHK